MSQTTPSSPPGVMALSGTLMRYALRRWPGLVGVLAVMLLRIGFDILKPWPLKILADNALDQKPMSQGLRHLLDWLPGTATPWGLAQWCVAAIVALFLLSWLLTTASSLINIGFGQRLTYDLAGDLFGHLQQLSLRFHSRRAVGDSIRRVTSDSTCASTIVKDGLLPIASSAVTIAAMFFILWKQDWLLALVSLLVVPMLLLALRRYAGPLLELSYAQQEVESRIYTAVEQTLSAIPVVQAFTREEDADRQFRQCTSETLSAMLANTRVQMKFKVATGFATACGTAAIMSLGAYRVWQGHLTVGSLLVFLSYLASLYAPLEALAYTSSTIQGAAGSARRVMEVFRTEPAVLDSPTAHAVGTVRGEIQFQQVSFGYETGRTVLADIDLHVHPGQTLAIVGPTGAGKSTLVGLIPRFFDPWSGCIRLDGQDLRSLKLRQLRQKIALVLQEPFLFPLSIAQNIAYGRPDASAAQIEAAARAANAHEFIVQLAQGYDSVIGERGATLSGGQRQRLSIARALLKDAPVLILDEPTSALDAQTESLLLEALERLMKGRTTFIIAHRLSTIRNADSILVLENGRIVQQGPHSQLIRQEGLYARFCALQFGDTHSGAPL